MSKKNKQSPANEIAVVEEKEVIATENLNKLKNKCLQHDFLDLKFIWMASWPRQVVVTTASAKAIQRKLNIKNCLRYPNKQLKNLNI